MVSLGEALFERAGAPASHHKNVRRCLLPGLVVVVVAIPKLWFLDYSVFGNDEAILLVYPEQLIGGRVPNQDFFTVYGPGNYIALAGVYSLWGPSLIAERLVGLIYQVATVAGVMSLSRRHGEVASTTAGLLSALLLSGPNLVALSWLGGLAMTVWMLSLLQRGGSRAAVAAGVLAGLVTFWRIEMGVLALAAVPLLWGERRFRLFLFGACVGALPTLTHLVITWPKMIRNVFFDRMGVNAQMDWSLVPGSVFVSAGLLLISTAVLLGLAIVRSDPASRSAAMLAMLMLPQAFQRIDYVHLVVMTGCVVYPLALAPLLSRRRMPRRGVVAAGLGLVVATLAAQAAAAPPAERVRHAGRSLYVNGAAQVEEAIEALNRHVPTGSRVFIGSSDMSVPTVNTAFLYHLLPEYRNDFYFLELHVGVAEREGSPLVADIKSADALVLTDYAPENRLYYPHFGTGAKDANEVVQSAFCPVERLPGATIYIAC